MVKVLNCTEIFQSFKEEFKYFKEQNMSNRESLARALEEFNYVCTTGKMQHDIVEIAYGELVITMEKISELNRDKTVKKLREIDFEIIKNDLTEIEFNEVKFKLSNILNNIGNIETTNYMCVCWFYNEFNDLVNIFLNEQLQNHLTVDVLIQSTLTRFKRDCNNTNSEKSIVYITLLERILEEYGQNIDGILISDLKQFIKIFKIEDIYNEQLNDKEIQLILKRINILKKKLFGLVV